MGIEKSNRIGYRHLYDSKGCSLINREEMAVTISICGKYDANVYFGSKPRHGIQIVSGQSKYFVPGVPCSLGSVEFKRETDSSSQHGPFFLEIEVSIEAEAVLSDNDAPANDLLRQAHRKRDEFRSVIHLIAGIIGLRFHRQFVLEPLNENALAWQGDTPVRAYGGPVVENLEPVCLNDKGIEYLETLERVFCLPSHR